MMKYIKIIIILLIAGLSMFFVHRLYAPYINVKTSPEKALEIRKEFSKALIQRNKNRAKALSEGNVKLIQRDAFLALKSDPLNDDAIAQHALSLMLLNDLEAMPALLAISEDRNGRNILGARLRLSYAANQGNYDKVVEEVSLLYKLDKKQLDRYIGVLDDLWKAPQGQEAILQLISESPGWDEAFVFRHLNRFNDASQIPLLKKLIETFVGTEDQSARMKSVFVNQLINLKQYDEAYNYWHSDGEKALRQDDAENFIFNSKFQSLDIGGGFNWVFPNTPKTTTEYLLDGGLFVRFKLNKKELVLFQTIRLPQQARLKFEHKTTYNTVQGSGAFEWVIRCAETEKLLANLKVLNDRSKRSKEAIDGSVNFASGNCRYARVELFAVPGNFSSHVSANILNAKITQQ